MGKLLPLRCNDVTLELVDELHRNVSNEIIRNGIESTLTTSRIVCADFERISSSELGEKNAVWHVRTIPAARISQALLDHCEFTHGRQATAPFRDKLG